MSDRSTGLRERTRRAVQREITEAAQRLILERGYAATTIDDIAAALSMSQRSVFRYFPTKEELVLGKFDFVAEEMLALLRGRPVGEALWVSLRQIFEPMVPQAATPGYREAAEAILRVMLETPGLFASYLERLQRMQQGVLAIVLERDAAADAIAARAVVAAAFGCLVAAQQAWLVGGAERPFAEVLDRTMAAMQPA